MLVRVFMEPRYLMWESAKSTQMSRRERMALWNLDICLVVSLSVSVEGNAEQLQKWSELEGTRNFHLPYHSVMPCL